MCHFISETEGWAVAQLTRCWNACLCRAAAAANVAAPPPPPAAAPVASPAAAVSEHGAPFSVPSGAVAVPLAVSCTSGGNGAGAAGADAHQEVQTCVSPIEMKHVAVLDRLEPFCGGALIASAPSHSGGSGAEGASTTAM